MPAPARAVHDLEGVQSKGEGAGTAILQRGAQAGIRGSVEASSTDFPPGEQTSNARVGLGLPLTGRG